MLPILNQSFWRDEAFSALLSSHSPLEIIRLTSKDFSPPLYYIVLHYWVSIFGNNEIVFRSLSFVFHIFIAIVAFLIIKRITKSIWVQILTTFVIFANPFLLQYAFEARQYSLLCLLCLCVTYFLIDRKYFIASIFLGLGIYTHNFAVFTFLASFIWCLLQRVNLLKNLLKLSIIPLISLSFWGSIMLTQWQHVAREFWITRVTTAIFTHSLEVYTSGDLIFDLQPLLYLLSLGIIFLASSYWINHKKDKDNYISIFITLSLLPIFITYLISVYFAPIYHERYLIASLPLIIIAIAYSLWKLYNTIEHIRIPLIFIIGMYMIVLVQSSEKIVNISTKPAINWGIEQVISLGESGDILISDPINFLEAKYYLSKSSKNIKLFAYLPKGEPPFYIGKILFKVEDIIHVIPKDKTVWKINSDGGFKQITKKIIKNKINLNRQESIQIK